MLDCATQARGWEWGAGLRDAAAGMSETKQLNENHLSSIESVLTHGGPASHARLEDCHRAAAAEDPAQRPPHPHDLPRPRAAQSRQAAPSIRAAQEKAAAGRANLHSPCRTKRGEICGSYSRAGLKKNRLSQFAPDDLELPDVHHRVAWHHRYQMPDGRDPVPEFLRRRGFKISKG
jgi:hypothetical protein